MDENTIKKTIETALTDATVTVTGDGYHVELCVVSRDFNSLTRILRHQLIYALFTEQIQRGDLHALTIKTYTPEEVEQAHG